MATLINLLIRVALWFLGLAPAPKVNFYENIVSSMTGNTAFPTPLVPLTDMTAQIGKVKTKMAAEAAAYTGWQTIKSEMQQEIEKLDAMGLMQARYVGGVAQGDRAIIESSGYPVTSSRTPIGVLPAPQSVLAVAGQAGTANVRWPTLRGAAVYIVEYSLSPEGGWLEVYRGTRARCVVPDLLPGSLIWVRVSAIGAAGQSDWSVPTNCRVI